MKRWFSAAAVVSASLVVSQLAQAQNLLLNGNLEVSAIEFPDWTTQEFRTGSSAEINSIVREQFANRQGEITGQSGGWFRPWAAGDMSTEKVNAILQQSVAGTAGETYTLKGWSNFEQNYAGGRQFLDILSPSDPMMTGEVPSPTNTYIEMAFLDGTSNVLGSPTTLDLRVARGPTPNNATWMEHTLMGVAPAGTASVRVRASMIDGVFNINPRQSAFIDDFSLTTLIEPAVDKLVNGNLNAAPPELPVTWTLTELPPGRDSGGGADFANREAPGVNGFWLKPFSGSLASPSDAILSQTLAGAAGTQYTFSGWSKWEANYAGGLAMVSGQPSPTKTLLELAFLDANGVIGAPLTVDLKASGQTNDGVWRQYSVNGTAPAGTTSVRVSAIMDDGVGSGLSPQSAFFDDFVLTAAGGNNANFDGDSDVDGNDFLIWQRNIGTGTTLSQGDANGDMMVNGQDLAIWKSQFGPFATAAANGVPEPSTCAMAVLTIVGLCGPRARRRPR